MRFVYLHGYQGFVTDEKRKYLNSLGDCYAPHIDYDYEPMIVQELIEKLQKEPVDFIAGTSLGGMISYYLGIVLDIPVLMFNPAVIAIERLKPFLPTELINRVPVQKNYIFTGLQDDVVEPSYQIEFVEKLKEQKANIKQFFYKEMSHLVTIEEFETAFKTFLELKNNEV